MFRAEKCFLDEKSSKNVLAIEIAFNYTYLVNTNLDLLLNLSY